MELDLQSLFGLHVLEQQYSLAETPYPPPPRIWAHIKGHYWSAKIDDISLRPPASYPPVSMQQLTINRVFLGLPTSLFSQTF
jgi:hypothetical protein